MSHLSADRPEKSMKIFGVQLHTPGLADLHMTVIILLSAVVCSGLAMRFLGWDIAQVSAILFGSTAAAIATACGVDEGVGVVPGDGSHRPLRGGSRYSDPCR
jgi:hypothetical protein